MTRKKEHGTLSALAKNVAICAVMIGAALTVPALAETGKAASDKSTWGHVHLNAPDAEKAAAWYRQHFGGDMETRAGFPTLVYGADTSGEREIRFKKAEGEILPSAGSSIDHIGFSVPNVAAKLEAMKSSGAKLLSGPHEFKAKASEDNSSEETLFHFAFVEDPWGTKIELIDDADISGFHHVHLATPDRDTTFQWFTKSFGGSVSLFKNQAVLPGIRYGDMWLLIRTVKEPLFTNKRAASEGRAIDHLSWNIPDMTRFQQQAETNGDRFIFGPQRFDDMHIVFIENRDGIKIEARQLHDVQGRGVQDRP